eukprot:1450542-Pyramimonas_sp.AAC.1
MEYTTPAAFHPPPCTDVRCSAEVWTQRMQWERTACPAGSPVACFLAPGPLGGRLWSRVRPLWL